MNDILRMGERINLENLSYQTFQKGYGRSTQFRASGKFVAMLRRKAEGAGDSAKEFPTHTTRLSQVCLCGMVEKKPLSQRWHRCACGVVTQRDLISAFLALCVEDEKLNAEKAREIRPTRTVSNGVSIARNLRENHLLRIMQTSNNKK